MAKTVATFRENSRGYIQFPGKMPRLSAWRRTGPAKLLLKTVTDPVSVVTRQIRSAARKWKNKRDIWLHPSVAGRFAAWLSPTLDTQLKAHIASKNVASVVQEYAERLSLRLESDFFNDRNVIYLGYIGGGHFKYGHSSNFRQRMLAHQRNFDRFTVVQTCVCENGLLAERLLRGYFGHRKMMVDFQHQGTPLKEIVAISGTEQLRHAIRKMEKISRSGENVLELARISLQEKETELERDRLRLIAQGKISLADYFQMRAAMTY